MANLTITQQPRQDVEMVSLGEYAILDCFNDEDLAFDDEKLSQIVELNNARINDTGDMIPLVVGHRVLNAPESEQPEILGYARNLRLGSIGKLSPRQAIFAEFVCDPENVERIKQYPRRSVEVWDDGMIDPIALLGATTPRRSLGLLLGKDHADKCNSQILEVTQERIVDMDEAQLVELIAKTISAMPEFAWIKKQMESTPVEELEEPVEVEEVVEEVVEVPEEEQTAMKLQRDQMAIRLAQLEKQHAETKKQADQAVRELRRTKREAELKQLSYEGYVFDLASEVQDVQDLDDASYAKHLERIRSRYQRNPVGGSPIPDAVTRLPAQMSRDEEKKHVEKCLEYAQEHKCSLAEAKKACAS